MSSFVRRVLTAIVFVVVMVGGVYLHPYTFVGLFGLITVLAIWEYLNLALAETKGRRDVNRKFLGLILGIVPFILVAIHQLGFVQDKQYIWYATFLMLPLVFLAFIYEMYTASEKPFANIGILLLGMVYIGVPFALLLLIGFLQGTFSPNIVFGLLAMTWMNDTGAYLVGSQIGKNQIISKNLSWQNMGRINRRGCCYLHCSLFIEFIVYRFTPNGLVDFSSYCCFIWFYWRFSRIHVKTEFKN